MSKVVTIPTYQSPFVVMVNGVKYVFPAGSVQEVPDEVAVVIEANGRKKPEEPVDAPFDCCEGGGSGGGAQSDWNQTDSSAADFIKNKPFYKKVENAVFLSYSQLGYDAESSSFFGVLSAHLTAGATYSVNYNGTIYLCQSYDLMGIGVALGNGLTFGMDDTGEPFAIVAIDYGENIALMGLDGATEVFLGISGELATIKRIDAEFAPYIEFYIGIDDDYLYKDASLTEKAYYGDVNEALNMRVPLYVCRDREPEPAVIFSRAIGVDSDGNGYFYIWIKMPSGGTNNTVTYKEYYTAEYTPPTT